MRTDKGLDDNRLSTEDIAGADRHQDTQDETRYQDMPDETTESRDLGTTDRYDDDLGTTEQYDMPKDDMPKDDMPRDETRGMAEDEPLETADTEHTEHTEHTGTVGMAPSHGDDAPLELFGTDEVDRFRDEWRELQGRFVDDPREAVQGADHLVAEVMKSLATTFTEHKHELEGQWQQDGSEAQTEELRLALRRYRTFFNQLLNA